METANGLKRWPAASKPLIVTGGGSCSWLAGDPSGVARGRRGTTPKASDDSFKLQLLNLTHLSDLHICDTNYALEAIKADGSVVSWGSAFIDCLRGPVPLAVSEV